MYHKEFSLTKTHVFAQLSLKIYFFLQTENNHFLLFHFQRKHSNESVKLHSWIKRSCVFKLEYQKFEFYLAILPFYRDTLVSNFKFHKFLMQTTQFRAYSDEIAWKFPREAGEWRIRKNILGRQPSLPTS